MNLKIIGGSFAKQSATYFLGTIILKVDGDEYRYCTRAAIENLEKIVQEKDTITFKLTFKDGNSLTATAHENIYNGILKDSVTDPEPDDEILKVRPRDEIELRNQIVKYGVFSVLCIFMFFGLPHCMKLTDPAYIRQANIREAQQLQKKKETQQAVWLEITKDAVRARLKDSRSAEFRNVVFKEFEGAPIVCGEVNSNNSFGGKAGFQRFVASGEDLVFIEEQVSDFNKAWAKICGNKS